MRSVGIELCFEIDEYRAARCKFLIGDGLLKFCIAFVYLGVERGSINFFSGHCKLVNKCEMKTAEAFDGGIASGFRKRRSAAARNEDCGRTNQNISSKRR